MQSRLRVARALDGRAPPAGHLEAALLPAQVEQHEQLDRLLDDLAAGGRVRVVRVEQRALRVEAQQLLKDLRRQAALELERLARHARARRAVPVVERALRRASTCPHVRRRGTCAAGSSLTTPAPALAHPSQDETARCVSTTILSQLCSRRPGCSRRRHDRHQRQPESDELINENGKCKLHFSWLGQLYSPLARRLAPRTRTGASTRPATPGADPPNILRN